MCARRIRAPRNDSRGWGPRRRPAARRAFPRANTVTIDGKQFLDLSRLVELKLASGLSATDRPRDFDDVIQLIRANGLPESFARRLHPEVQPKYRELWGHAQRRVAD